MASDIDFINSLEAKEVEVDVDFINSLPSKEQPRSVSGFDEIEFAGTKIDVPTGSSPEEISSALDKFKKTEEFDRLIDKESGAPARVRAVVGSLTDAESRLATIKKFYPDAFAFEDDNFVFTDPATGKPTLYNPKGLDLGDVASVAREVTITVGGGLGAAAGVITAAGATVATGGVAAPTIPPAALVGSGFGSAIAATAFDHFMDLFTRREDVRGAGQQITDIGVEFAAGFVGEGAGRAIPVLAKKALGGGTAAVRNIVAQFQRLGIDPPASVISEGEVIGRVEAALAQSATGGEILQKQALIVVEQTKTAVDTALSKVAVPRTKQGTGEVIKQAAINAVERFGFKKTEIYEEAFDLIGPETIVDTVALKELLAGLENQLAAAPKSEFLRKSLSPAIKEIKGILDTEKISKTLVETGILDEFGKPITKQFASGGEGLKFETLREIRTQIGNFIGDPLTRSLEKGSMSRVYGALTIDMSGTAAKSGKTAAKKLSDADKFTREWMETTAKTMDKISRFDADEKAFRFALSSSRDGGTALARMRINFDADEWDIIASSVINRLGDATAGAQDAAGDVFSIGSFMTNWNKLAPEAKDALFGGVRFKELRGSLDDLTQVMAELKSVHRFVNTSNTAGTIHTLLVMNALGGSAALAATGDPAKAGGTLTATIVGSVILPKQAAKLITSKAFVRWLATPASEIGSSIPAHMARLTAIAEASPGIRDEIEQFLKALRPAPEEQKEQ